MDTEKAYSAIRSLIRVRHLLGDALSSNNSLIPIDILLAASCVQHDQGKTLTVKQLFAQLHHSDRAVRMHFNRLVADGVLLAEAGAGDRRTKSVRLSSRGEKLLMRAAGALIQGCEPAPPPGRPRARVGARRASTRR